MQPGRGGRPRQLVRSGVPGRTSPSSTRSCSTRSSPTSTATAGCSAPSSRRTARATASTTRATSLDDVDHRAAHGRGRDARRRSRSSTATGEGRASRARSPSRDGVPVHLMDIHLEKGMHCVDCHFVQDVHGNTQALTAKCGRRSRSSASTATAPSRKRATLRTSGPAASDVDARHAEPRGRNLAALRTPSGKRALRAARRQALFRTRWSRRT